MAVRNWLPALTGAAGTAIGSVVPGLGTALGGAGGTALGSILSSLMGGSSKNRSNMRNYTPQVMPQQGNQMAPNAMKFPGGSSLYQMPNYTPQQQDIYSQLGQQGMAGMGALPSAEFGPIRQFYENRFNQQVVPGLMERFSGLGAGSQRSSAFEQALGSADAQSQAQLAAMEQMFNQQNRQTEIDRLMSMLQFGLQPQFQQGILPPEQGIGSSLLGGVGQGFGMLAPLAAMWGYNKYMGS